MLIFILSIELGIPDLTLTQISSPAYRGAVTYIRTLLDTGNLSSAYPEVPTQSYDELRRAVAAQLTCYEHPLAASGNSVPPQSPGLSLWASDLAGATRVDRQWSFNGTTCARLGPGKISVLFWLDNLLSALRGEYNIHDGTQQGLCLRQLVSDDILHKLSRKIDELPDLRRHGVPVAAQGEATFDNYAAALISCQCSDPDDALACHYAASHPRRQPGERLGHSVARADLAFRPAAAHCDHCQPPASGLSTGS